MAPRKRAARRKPGTGSIRYKKGRSLPWETAFPLDHGGHRYDYFATPESAAAHLDRLTAERDSKETPRNVTAGSQRVDQFLRSWLEMKSIRIKPTTLADYNYQCILAIERIGAYRVDEVNREIADALIVYYHRREYQNISQLLMVMKQAFQYAEDEEYIKKNPFARIKAPSVKRRETIALTKDQRDRLLYVARAEDNPAIPLLPLWHLYSRLALRRGEGIGLRWGDIDEKAMTITVRQHTTRAWSKTITGTPKTPRSARVIPVPSDIMDLLKAHRVQQIRIAASNPEWRVTGLVFVDETGEQVRIGQVDWRWVQLREHAGLPEAATIHGLRHTALTIMEKGNTPPSVVQAFAGHSSATMTRHYVDHTTIDEMRAAIERSA
jgi:integrase